MNSTLNRLKTMADIITEIIIEQFKVNGIIQNNVRVNRKNLYKVIESILLTSYNVTSPSLSFENKLRAIFSLGPRVDSDVLDELQSYAINL